MRNIRTGFVLLFALAGCLGLVAVPLKVLSWIPDGNIIPAIIPIPERPFWHGHAMVAGYAQVVLGGYLLTRPGNPIIILFICLWIFAQIAIFIPGQTGIYPAAAGNIAVFGLLFLHAGRAFFRAAKRLKSAIPGIVILLLLLAESTFQSGEILDLWMLRETALRSMIWLLIILLFLMGGRIIAAATSGALQKRSMYRPYMAQGRLESHGLGALAAAALSDMTGLPTSFTAVFGLLAAMVIFRRLWNWRVWLVRDVFDLTSLHLGYTMLAVGLIFKSLLDVSGPRSGLADFHGAMIGGFAILSTTVMCRTVLQRLRFSLSLPPMMRLSEMCLLAAAVTRMGAVINNSETGMLMASAILWELGFAGFIITLICILWRFHRSGRNMNAFAR